ncbi:MAG: hypothetical protein HZA66_03045 [Rhodopseudomonas palustris]|uniref:Uncharacterized protein n=1 Tax=Rhodopseudomonas palustris TaxID=1076 RepID=A0A933RUE7_RHOPL|nr:hypothetical protein [Rhodopseudomonas palustris]
MRRDRNSDTARTTALQLWLKAAICLCALAVIVLGTASVASAHDAPRDQLAFVKTLPPVPAPNVSDEPEICTPEASATVLDAASLRGAVCDQSTRLRLPLAEMMLDRSERPLLRPPIAA